MSLRANRRRTKTGVIGTWIPRWTNHRLPTTAWPYIDAARMLVLQSKDVVFITRSGTKTLVCNGKQREAKQNGLLFPTFYYQDGEKDTHEVAMACEFPSLKMVIKAGTLLFQWSILIPAYWWCGRWALNIDGFGNVGVGILVEQGFFHQVISWYKGNCTRHFGSCLHRRWITGLSSW